tara:strand:+ start:2832 stop:4376 length:1545 start_codon:yes stop_codon:yes gene_type:complete
MSKKTNWLEQNPCDYFNENHIKEAVEIIKKADRRMTFDGTTFSIGSNGTKIDVIKIENNFFNVLSKNDIGLSTTMKYSPFQILVKFKYKNNFKAAFHYVGLTYQDMEFPYIRVGIKYFKVVKKTDRFGINRDELIIWSKEEFKQDYGKDMIARINTYDDFILEPNNHNYVKVYRGFYNLYSPFPHSEKEYDIEDLTKLKWSIQLLKHIFGKQYELGLKYLKVLYENPKQAMPILVLTSEERSTGKSTFVDWLSILFGSNMVIINPQDISSTFNSSYATKNIIAIEESRFDSVQATEKLKALATQKTLLVNTKFVNPYNTPFYGKLIITSNDESKFSKVDEAEIRYWVRKVPKIEISNHNILNDLTDEIPYLLYYLSKLEKVDTSKSRMVFTSEEISTSALKTVKSESKPELQKEIEMLLEEFCLNNQNSEEILFTASDLKDSWFNHSHNFSRSYISKVIKGNMKLEPSDKTIRYLPTISGGTEKVGRIFSWQNPYYKSNNVVLNKNIESDDVPF